MNIRLENRDAFYVSGYLTETTYETHDKNIGSLWIQHEGKLRSVQGKGAPLYGATWYADNGESYFYLLGIDRQDQATIDESATRVEIPSALFAVATVPEGMPLLEAWTELFDKGLPSVGHAYIDGEKCFDFFGEGGVREIWIPVTKI